jgi:CheY-like chemotaxis protein
VVLLDLVMPGMPDAEALEDFRELDPTVPIAVVSGNRDEDLCGRSSRDRSGSWVRVGEKRRASDGPSDRSGRAQFRP